jgi:CelD/BcsL family acetyltransferase involved in cellulose biosynthesis
MAVGCEIELIRTDDALAALGEEWDALHAESELRNPFLTFAWTMACRRHECPRSEPFVLTVRQRGRLVGIAPLRLDRYAGFRVLRFLGDGRSDYLGFLNGDEGPGNVEQLLLGGLRELHGEWDLAVLRQLAEPYSGLASVLPPKGLLPHRVVGTIAPHLTFDGDWEQLLETGPGWLRRMRKAAKKWIKDGGSYARISGAEAVRYVDQVAEVEAQSWKGEQGVARFQPGPGQSLLQEALRGLAPAGAIELWLAWMDNRPAAYDVNFRSARAVWVYQGAYVPRYAKYSAGGILDYLSFEQAWRDGLREYDFLCGDEPYKAERTSGRRTVHYLALHPATTRGYLAYRVLIAPRWGLKDYAPIRFAYQRWTRWRRRAAKVRVRRPHAISTPNSPARETAGLGPRGA